MSSSRKPRPDRPLVEQHEEWMAHLRRQAVSRRTVFRGAVGAAAGSLLLGSSARWFGDDPTREMWAGGQLFNINQYNAVPPRPA